MLPLRRGATVSADQLPLPRLYTATGRARRRKWRYIKYTPLPVPFIPLPYHYRSPFHSILYCRIYYN